ncbi:LOW QUALITY PROTEIN: hypothetical protein BRARA_J00294 [Brassica rapa]|uniref:Ubiquitin-like protease family profile domain-containing protein n=1 Tax=Brassica campestris TaxID=3711 RepID=A0A397XQF4_BRACM|nr:LOW QUALITY PROTEIN: hypothetical protein BRARA_J00294 [Brassica rapa]
MLHGNLVEGLGVKFRIWNDLLVSRPNRTEPLILQCTFKPNRIIYRPYISRFLYIRSERNPLRAFSQRRLVELRRRLVHYMLGFQLDIKKKYELWSLVGPQPVRFSLSEFVNLTGLNCEYIEDLERPHYVVTKELTSFWEMLGVHVEDGPSTQEIIAAFERCKGLARLVMELEQFENYPWGRVAFKVMMDSMKGRDISGCDTINGFAQALQVWVYTALPELGAYYGNPLPNNPSTPIMAYKSRKGHIQFKEAILSQLVVVSPAKKKVVKEDSRRPRKKARKETPAEASEEAPAEASEEVHTVARSEVTTTVGGLTKEDIKTMFKYIVDAMREGFGTCLKEIKYLSERVEAAEKKKEDARYQEKRDAALAFCRAKSDRTRKLAASQQSPYTENNTAKVIIPNKKFYPGYNPFAPIDKKKLKEIDDWLKTFLFFEDDLPISRLHIDVWINVLRKRYDANPQHFRSERMCFLDHLFAQQYRFNYKDFKDSEPDQNSLGRRLPGGAWNYYAVNYTDSHWIAMWISIPKRHIVVWDIICSSISPDELDVVMKHFLYMVHYLLVKCASSDEQRAQYSLEPFTYERLADISQARAGDCGVYTLKYIECHALGMPFNFDKPNGKTMRDKMVVDIFKELPDAHEFENKDNGANLGDNNIFLGLPKAVCRSETITRGCSSYTQLANFLKNHSQEGSSSASTIPKANGNI